MLESSRSFVLPFVLALAFNFRVRFLFFLALSFSSLGSKVRFLR